MDEDLMLAARDSAARLGVEKEVLAAVALVESAGRALAMVKGKPEPVIRFEGHYFDRRLGGSERALARTLGLAAPVAGAVKNPAGQEARWAMLEQAAAINRQAALESASYGVGQVMGAHWQWLGYPSVEALVDDARSGLSGQMRLMERFIDKSGLSSALRQGNWAAFARGYNGPAFAKNGYDRKLAAAVERMRRRTAPDDAALPEPVADGAVLRMGMKGEAVADLQRLLTANGYLVETDGDFGRKTAEALKTFQKASGLRNDGLYGPQSKAALERAAPSTNPLSNVWNWLKRLCRAWL